jgi:glucokinase
MARDPCYLGVDLGGTQLRLAAVAPDGTLSSEVHSVPTGKEFGPEDLRRRIGELVARVRSDLAVPVAALGFGIAGVVGQGPISQCDNLPRLNGVDVAGLLQEVVEAPVALENDARCFTLAEARFGAGRGARDVCGITLGTGVGCGVMIGGRLHRGAGSQSGEVWRIPVRGRHLEYFLSGAGVVRGYAAAGGRGDPEPDAAGVQQRALAGDAAALEAWRSFGEDFALLCEAVVALLDPELIVVGGSLWRASGLYRPLIEERLAKDPVRLVDAALGPAAGVIGAAALNIDGVGGADVPRPATAAPGRDRSS